MPSIAIDSIEFPKILSKITAKTWIDDEFRKHFIAYPVVVLEENGLTLPRGTQVRVNENASIENLTNMDATLQSNSVYEIPLPPKPDTLKQEQIQSWADGNESKSPAICF